MNDHKIITASILSADFTRLGEQIREAQDAGSDWIHIDVMDGHFVPNLTMGPFIVEACRQVTALPLDVHLMIEKPENFIENFVRAGANLIYVQIETCPHIHRTLDMIHELGCSAGVVINPGTPASAIHQVLHMVDTVLVMTVNPGYSGQKFIPEMLPKIKLVRSALNQVNPEAMIAVDGGINAQNIHSVMEAGAQIFVAATAIFKHPRGIAAGIEELRENLVVKREVP